MQRRVDPLRKHDVDADRRVVGQPARVGRAWRRRACRPGARRRPGSRAPPRPRSARRSAPRAGLDAEALRVGDRPLRRVVELAGDHAHRRDARARVPRAPLGGDGRDVGDDDAGLDEQAQLEAKLRALRRGHQRALAELLGQDDGDDLTVLAQPGDRLEHRRRRVAPLRQHVEPRLAAGQVEPACVDAGVRALARNMQRRERSAGDAARVPDGALGRHVDRLGIDENPVVHTLTVLLRNDEGPAFRRPFVSFGSCSVERVGSLARAGRPSCGSRRSAG